MAKQRKVELESLTRFSGTGEGLNGKIELQMKKLVIELGKIVEEYQEENRTDKDDGTDIETWGIA